MMSCCATLAPWAAVCDSQQWQDCDSMLFADHLVRPVVKDDTLQTAAAASLSGTVLVM